MAQPEPLKGAGPDTDFLNEIPQQKVKRQQPVQHDKHESA
jgi:hypothetical protein